MRFLFVRPEFCPLGDLSTPNIRLSSDSTSRWTPLLLAIQFPLLGLARDFHPLDNAHAERTASNRHRLHTDADGDYYIFAYKIYSNTITESTISVPTITIINTTMKFTVIVSATVLNKALRVPSPNICL